MNSNRLRDPVITLAVLLLITAVALWLRIWLPFSQVFVGNWIKLTGLDADYYMRLVDNIARHFPTLTGFDPYMQFPGGSPTGYSPDLYAYLVSTVVWIAGLGTPGQQLIDAVSVYVPPALAAVAVITVFFIGRALVNRWMGLMAAGLLAIMPGEFLGRSVLGYTDHHMAEVLFSSLLILFTLLSVKAARSAAGKTGRGIDNPYLRGWLEPRPMVYGLLGGVALGLYLLTWAGGLMFVLVIFLYFLVQSAVDHGSESTPFYLITPFMAIFGAGLILYLPWARGSITYVSLAAAFIAVPALIYLSSQLGKRRLAWYFYPLCIAALGIVAFAAIFFISRELFEGMTGYLVSIFSWNITTTVGEAQPLLWYNGDFTTSFAMGNFLLAFPISILALGLVANAARRRRDTGLILLLTWSLVSLMIALAMRRFCYYYAINAALLTGYAGWSLVNWASSLGQGTPAVKAQRRKKRTQPVQEKAGRFSGSGALMLAAVLLFVYYPNIGPLPDGTRPAPDLAARPPYAPADAWYEAMDWLRKTSPEPFGEAGAYYSLYRAPGADSGFVYPADAYGVMTFWDCGYRIMHAGRRAPTSNPGTGETGESIFFTSLSESAADARLKRLGTRYVVIDGDMATYDKKLISVAAAAGIDYRQLFDVFMQKQGNTYVPLILYRPEFYWSTLARLYYFNGKSVTPEKVGVVGYEEVTIKGSLTANVITDARTFGTYQEAMSFITEQKGKKYIVAGDNPARSPVPIAAMHGYRLVYASGQRQKGNEGQPMVKIFEFKPDIVPVTGDWNGDGKYEIGTWSPDTRLFLLDMNGDGKWGEGDLKLGPLGNYADVPVAGDWNGDGKSETGLWNASELCFFLDVNRDGRWDAAGGDIKCKAGNRIDDTPLAGDWSGEGRDRTGVATSMIRTDQAYRTFYGDNGGCSKGSTGMLARYDYAPDLIPITGDWNGDGKQETGRCSPLLGLFSLDMNGDGRWVPDSGDLKLGPFGGADDVPLAGDWTGKGRSLIGTWNPHDRCFYQDLDGDGKWGEGDRKLGPFGE
jgi:dolichyl-diphosphooligosaccharide--protein glycosyltransferase